MKVFVVLFALAAIFLSAIEANNQLQCSPYDYKPAPYFDVLGKWIVYKTYNNGPEIDMKCSFYEMAKNDHLNIVWRSEIWKDNSKTCTKGYFTYTKPDLTLVNVNWADSVQMPLTIVSTDFETYLIARTCLENEEYVWIMTRLLNPSKETIKLIYGAIIEQGLDKSKLHRSCVGFKDSELEGYF